MLLERFRPVKLEHAALDLGASDTGDMVELASLTRPGPFLPGTPRFGGFVGIRVKMAGLLPWRASGCG